MIRADHFPRNKSRQIQARRRRDVSDVGSHARAQHYRDEHHNGVECHIPEPPIFQFAVGHGPIVPTENPIALVVGLR